MSQIGERLYQAKTAAERRGARRQRLLAAALDAFGNHGYAATSIEGLCAEAGVSTRNFYEEFESREELLLTLHDDLNRRALETVAEAIAEIDPADLDARALAGVHAYFEVMTSDRRWARIALVESVGVSPAAEARRRAAIDRFGELLRTELGRLADEGSIPARDFDLISVALVGAINGLINLWAIEGTQPSLDDVVETAARLIVTTARDRG